MSGEHKNSIRKRIILSMAVIVAGACACCAVAVWSIIFLRGHIDTVVDRRGIGMINVLEEASSTAFIFCIIIIALVVATIILSIISVHNLASRIQRPLGTLEEAAYHVRVTGNIKIPEEMAARLHEFTKTDDEVASVIVSFNRLMDDLLQKVKVLEKVAEGDLRHKVTPASDEDYLSIALNDVMTNLGIIVRDVIGATEQLSASANELSLGAQSLSQSSNEQSVTMDQLHITAGEIATEALDNAGRAAEVSRLAAEINKNAVQGGNKMEDMAKAMKEIHTASNAISSVMKAIDEIAFQTNILALNAAVEAARAGVHGKGFAVVADEVRNLATKSGSAANDSNALIADTITKSNLGTKIVDEAFDFFKTIEEGIANTNGLLDEMAHVAKCQSDAIEQINTNVTDMTNAVYHNSATAEQSAAASEEMSSQALLLKETVQRFLIDGNSYLTTPPPYTTLAYEPIATEIPVYTPEPLSLPETASEPFVFEPAEPPVYEPEPAVPCEAEPQPPFYTPEPFTHSEPGLLPLNEPEPQPHYEPAPAPEPHAQNPTTETPADGGLSPAAIYAKALERESAHDHDHDYDNERKTGFTDDSSKY